MAATIQIAAGGPPTVGSIEAAAATLCTFSNLDNTSVYGWEWELIDKPAGSAATLSATLTATTTLTPDVPGTYMVRLTTYYDSARTLFNDTDEQGVGVRYTGSFLWRLMSAFESTQFDAVAGWKAELNDILDQIRTALLASGGGITELTDDVTAGPGSGAQVATVEGIQGRPVNAAAPAVGDAYRWTGAEWLPASIPTAVYELTNDVNAGPGTGTQAATVVALQGNAVSGAAPGAGEALVWNGLAWTPTAVGGGGITELTGDVTAGPGSGAQAATLAEIQGTPVSAGTPVTHATLYHDGTNWIDAPIYPDGTYVYQPGGTAIGKVYTNFATLYTAASADPAPTGIVVLVDGSAGSVEIPAGTYDFNGWTFKSATIERTPIYFMDGVDVPYSGVNPYVITFDSVIVQPDPGGLTQPTFTPGGGGSQDVLRLNMINSTMAGDSANTLPIIDASPTVVGATLDAYLTDSTLDEWSVEADNAAQSVSIQVTGDGISFLADSALQGAATALSTIQRTAFGALSASPNLTVGTRSYDFTGGDRVRLSMEASQYGTSEKTIGAIYLLEGAAISTANFLMGALGGGTDEADVRLRRFTGGTLIETWNVVGPLANASLPSGTITIANSDWYYLTLAAGGATQTALCYGANLIVNGNANVQAPA